jgi:hypothetical protein
MLSTIHHKLHGLQFDNNNHVKLIFYRFVYNKHKCHSFICIVWTLIFTRRNMGICNHPICNYMQLCVIYCYFCNYLPTSPNLGRICNYTANMCNYYFLHPPMWMLLRLYLSMNNPPWPISCMCHYIKMHPIQLHMTTWYTHTHLINIYYIIYLCK